MERYQSAFGAVDMTTKAMQSAIEEWFHLYYRSDEEQGENPCQRIAYTVVGKLVRSVFAEYGAKGENPFVEGVLQAFNDKKEQAVQLALVGGECYLKPWHDGKAFGVSLIPRNQILIFGRDPQGEPTDVGTVEKSCFGGKYYTLAERRWVDEKGFLTVENRLFRSGNPDALGSQVPLTSHPAYRGLAESYTYAVPFGSVGLIRMKTPMLGCVDGSCEGVSVYAAACGLIHAIDRNEFLLTGEFERGQSRVFASRDLLREGQLQENLFVGLDEDPEQVGITLFSPQLRQEAYLARKKEYLRNVESVIGLQRGMLSDVNREKRTATEITASEAEHCLTVMDFQKMWEKALSAGVSLCQTLGQIYRIAGAQAGSFSLDWGNGVLYDEENGVEK